MSDKKETWRVVKTVQESPDVTSVVIETEDDKAPAHKPGQFATIRVKTDDGWSEPHPFTISGDPSCKTRQFTIKNVDEFTSGIRDLQPGDEVICSGPLGVFCKDIAAHEIIVLIAGGVGVTPFLSVIRNFHNDKTKNKLILFWANKTLKDAFARVELAAIAKEIDLTVIHIISRETDLPPSSRELRQHYIPGRINQDIITRFVDSPTASFYICGPPAMQDYVIDELTRCGVSQDSIQHEAFTFKKR